MLGHIFNLAARCLVVGLGLALAASSGLIAVSAAEEEHGRPNVLVIMTDDQRADGSLGVMDATRRWFGGRGVTYTRAFGTTPTCCPARASVMTGQYVHNHGVKTSQQRSADNLDQTTTLQRYLADAGYVTALFGKYLNQWDVHTPPPYFHRYAMFSDDVRRAYTDGEWNVNGNVRKVSTYSTRFIRRKAMRFLREVEGDDERPWLMFVTPNAPHIPPLPQGRYAHARLPLFDRTPAHFEEDVSDKPPNVASRQVKKKDVRETRRNQLRTLYSVDDLVENLTRQLTRLGESRDTLAFFMSDNGYLWGEHGLVGKREPYEASVRIPLMARWPGVLPSGGYDMRLVGNIDIAPTVYDATGIEPDHTMDGYSLLGDHRRDRILLEYWSRPNRRTPDWASLWTDDYQYIEQYLADRYGQRYYEYYDLVSDPWQLTNVLADGELGNDPMTTDISLRLRMDMSCRGTSGPTACP